MSAVGSGGGPLQRPYTLGSFQKKLQDFQVLIKSLTLQDVEATPEERRQLITENLRYDQFCESIRSLFGNDIKNQDLKALYRKISTNPDAKVDWSELFGYFQSENEEQETPIGEDANIFTVSKKRRVGEAAGDRKRRDTIQCVKYIQSLDCYLAASQKGAVSLWNMKLRLQACADIDESAWITGCDYLPGLRRVVATTERSIAIWDNRAKGKTQIIYVIKPLEDSPQCMTYVPFTSVSHEEMVLFGDDQGYMNALTLSSQDLQLKNSNNKGGGGEKKAGSQNMVLDPKKLINPIRRRRLHDDWVVKVKYFPELRCFGSCSPSSISSFVLEEVERIFDNLSLRGVSIPKGVNAFDYCARANIIATGGVDKIIRVWHPHIFSRPTGKLIGHLFTIVDIVCNEKDQHIISLSTARVIRVWDIHTLTSLQVFTDNEERPGEKRIYSMLFDNKFDRLVTGSSVLDAWPLTRAVQDTMQVPHTHDRPISQILYNRELNQMITVCTESIIKVWEMETGKQVYQIADAHGSNMEVTAIALDKSGYRLATGALDSSVKVWDFGSGQEIKTRPGHGTDEDFSITGLLYWSTKEDRHIIATGWNNKILVLQDGNEGHDLPVLHEFSDHFIWPEDLEEDPFSKTKPLPSIGNEESGETEHVPKKHKRRKKQRKEHILKSHDVTCLSGLEGAGLFTGCVNGNVVLWNVNSCTVDCVFQLPEILPTSADPNKHRVKQPTEHRIHAIKILIHRVRKLDPAYIKSKLSHHDNDKTTEEEEESKEDGEGNDEEGEKSETHDEKDEKKEELPDKPEEGPTDEDPTETHEQNEQNGEETDKEHHVHIEGEESEDQKDDPEKHMIVETFDPILVTCHNDAFIRFWTMEGDVLREITAMTRRQGSPVTALCHDQDCNFLITGDNKGYLTMWDIAKFLEAPVSEDADTVKQILCWRAHTTKIVSLEYVDSLKAIISGSTDGSVRVWWGFRGRFVGFFSQHRPFNFPTSEEMAGTLVLPYDITERPMAPNKNKSAKQKIRQVQKFEYPLVFDNMRWKPFSRSAFVSKKSKRQEPEDKKFFDALIKPKAYNDHLTTVDTGHKEVEGAVYSTLPVYFVGKVDVKVKSPDLSFPKGQKEEEMPSYLYAGPSTSQHPAPQTHKTKKKSKGDSGQPGTQSPTRRR